MPNPTIVCVDDEPAILRILKSQLKTHFGSNLTIETCESAEEGLARIDQLLGEQVEIPVVISDQQMPGMKGDDFLTRLNLEYPSGIKKIMLTGQASAEAVGNAINNASLYRFIGKPWDVQDLNMTITEALLSYEQHLRLQKTEKEKEKLLEHLKEANETLESKVALRTVELQQKNRHITDSIKYAKLIQEAVFPSEKELLETIPQSFVYYTPKDIVSGDFFWCKKHADTQDYCLILADCTGHGVAGAFMSLIGLTKLNECISAYDWTQPHQVFDGLKKGIIRSLANSSDSHSSGMDASMVTWNSKEMVMNYCGAYTKLFLSRPLAHPTLSYTDGREVPGSKISSSYAVYTIDGDRQTIAKSSRDHMPFTNHRLQILQGDQIYLTTDGYLDQFDANGEKKFMRQRFLELILQVAEVSPQEKRDMFRHAFEQWKGTNEQTDDVCVVGFSV